MSFVPHEDPNSHMAVEAQQKFEFYFVALIFTILGFSLQNAPVNPSLLQKCSWGLFFLSGICGLTRLEYFGVLFRCKAQTDEQERNFGNSSDARAKEVLRINKKKFKWLEIKSSFIYDCQRISFIVGMLFLLISKMAWTPCNLTH